MPIIESSEDLKKKCAERKAKKGSPTKTGNPMGRPKGGNLMQKMINEAKPKDVKKVFEAMMTAATDPDHKNFAYANKALSDRWAHVSNYEKETSNSKPMITINIGDTDKGVEISGEATVVEE